MRTRSNLGKQGAFLLPMLVAGLVAASGGAAFAQPAPAAPPPEKGAAPGQPAPAAAARPAAPTLEAPDPIASGLAAVPGGLTPDEVGGIAARERPAVRAKQAELRAAAAKVDQAFVSYFPRVTLAATYTRLSETEASLGGGAVVGALNEGPIGVGPCPGAGGTTCALDSEGVPLQAQAFSFQSLPSSYSLTAQLAVPVSDYVLRISQGYAAASHAEKAKRLEMDAQGLQEAADAKIAFYNWVKARGGAIVAREAVGQAKAHLADARQTFEVGLISRADVLRLEAQVAAAQQMEAEAASFASLAEEQLRTILRWPASKPVRIGVDVMGGPADGPRESLDELRRQALERRLEIRALDETRFSLKETEALARAGYFPRLDAFADANYANPNPRTISPQEKWELSWDVGVRLTWVVNDTFGAAGATAEARHRTAALDEQKALLRDGLRLEVTSAYLEAQRALASIEAAERGLVAARESLRVRGELFRNGKATSADIVDAEAELTRARLRQLDARIGLVVAKTRLAHATGADVGSAGGGAPQQAGK